MESNGPIELYSKQFERSKINEIKVRSLFFYDIENPWESIKSMLVIFPSWL